MRRWMLAVLVLAAAVAGCTSADSNSDQTVDIAAEERFVGDTVVANITVTPVDGGVLTVHTPDGIRVTAGQRRTHIDAGAPASVQYRFTASQAGGYDIDIDYVERTGLLGGQIRAASTSVWVKADTDGAVHDASLSEVYPNQTTVSLD